LRKLAELVGTKVLCMRASTRHENIYDALEPRKVQLFPFAVRKLSCFVTVTSILSSAIYFVLAITVQNCKSPVTLGCIQKLYYSTTFYIEK
jgi:hypothetical protein